METLPIRWRPHQRPLQPKAALIERPLMEGIVELLRQRTLDAVATTRALVLFGETDALPWVRSIRYFGRDIRAPNLWLPTALEPLVPLDLLERAIRKRIPGPSLVDPVGGRLIPVAAAAPLDESALRELVERGV